MLHKQYKLIATHLNNTEVHRVKRKSFFLLTTFPIPEISTVHNFGVYNSRKFWSAHATRHKQICIKKLNQLLYCSAIYFFLLYDIDILTRLG